MTFEDWYGSDLTGQTYDGNLGCSGKGLTSLKGCPEVIDGHFYCYNNELTSLEHGPEIVNGNYVCFNNKLTTLEHGPEVVKGNFMCNHNKLTSLNGLCYAKRIGSDFRDEEVQEYLTQNYPEMLV